MNTMLSSIFDDAPESASASVTGEWFPVRLMPDIVTGELFNVGVALRTDDGQIHSRLIENAKPFKCLYGTSGVENFSFLLAALRQSLDSENLVQPSPHIRFGDPSSASGDSIDDVLDGLFDTMVSLRCNDDELLYDEKVLTYSTEKIQRKVFALMKKTSPDLYDRIYRSSPVILEDNNKHPLRLDLPIWNDSPDLCNSNGIRFGTIVSAYYRDKVHRHYNLDGGALNMVNATMLLDAKKSQGGIFILSPEDGAIGYSDSLRNEIENDIDRATWALQKRKNVTIKVSSNPHELMKSALEMAAA